MVWLRKPSMDECDNVGQPGRAHDPVELMVANGDCAGFVCADAQNLKRFAWAQACVAGPYRVHIASCPALVSFSARFGSSDDKETTSATATATARTALHIALRDGTVADWASGCLSNDGRLRGSGDRSQLRRTKVAHLEDTSSGWRKVLQSPRTTACVERVRYPRWVGRQAGGCGVSNRKQQNECRATSSAACGAAAAALSWSVREAWWCLLHGEELSPHAM
eukprot:TRINITY_DN58715_c0_g1_i1.p1 TRINITY_DN58715_c0_g1~~TRINITY_DN58715_c0_g1_i1.p1  ORF type:complete len:222 (+),score=12.00 TRINITY_DN58715_c0_g1_i1:522-1187(+)